MNSYKLCFLILILAACLYNGFLYLQLDSILVQMSDALVRRNHTFFTPAAENGFKLYYVKSHFLSNRSTLPLNLSRRYEILWWNQPDWMKAFKRNEWCNMSSCNYPNCVVSWDKARVNQSSAVIISIVDGKASDAPIEKRIVRQPWIFFSVESPLSYRSGVNRKWRGVFNWSMTCHHDADIFYPNARLIERSPPTKNYSGIFRNKTKQVAWIVSNCKTQALRENYVKILQKYISVDVYGTCGREGKRIQAADRVQVLSKYKFYLGFENAFCRDYVTEKYFQYIKYDIINVVRGLFDYNRLLPSRIFINTADFKSIEHLGNFLNRLSENENEYIKYLREKDKYEVYAHHPIHCDALCTICEKINNLPNTRKSYDSVTEWAGKCTSPIDIY